VVDGRGLADALRRGIEPELRAARPEPEGEAMSRLALESQVEDLPAAADDPLLAEHGHEPGTLVEAHADVLPGYELIGDDRVLLGARPIRITSSPAKSH
jgi:hypothetical protein